MDINDHKIAKKVNLESLILESNAVITICCCDAGAAIYLLNWIKFYDKKINFCLLGPALSIFEEKYNNLINLNLEEALLNTNLLITGTGWSTDLEISAIRLAKEKSIYTISVLDHWANYKERFLLNNKLFLPNQIWVADSIAYQIAQKEFPDTLIILKPNIWLENLKNKVQSIRQKNKKQINYPANNLIYFLEPIRKEWLSDKKESEEYQALNYFLDMVSNLQKLDYINPIINNIFLRLRLHPSESKEKYMKFVVENRSRINLEIGLLNSIEDDLAWCDIAYGVDTQALIAALECGIISISTKPPWGGQCVLPHPNLLHLRDLK